MQFSHFSKSNTPPPHVLFSLRTTVFCKICTPEWLMNSIFFCDRVPRTFTPRSTSSCGGNPRRTTSRRFSKLLGELISLSYSLPSTLFSYLQIYASLYLPTLCLYSLNLSSLYLPSLDLSSLYPLFLYPLHILYLPSLYLPLFLSTLSLSALSLSALSFALSLSVLSLSALSWADNIIIYLEHQSMTLFSK